ncbi:MAG TPA: P-loop NTPase [Gemmatimonadaceae bacterium]|jgi:MinD-like ATPase involved in chromosome partitioning or flagellar assembly
MLDSRFAANAPVPKSLIVASGKGGVGTSVIAAITAITAAERGDRVLLIDATESGGTHHHLFGARPTHSLWMLSNASVNPSDVALKIDDHLSLVAGGTSGSAITPANDAERRTALSRVTQLYAGYDFVVLDAGSRLDTISAACEIGVPSVLLVTSADRLSLAANYALVKSINGRRPGMALSVVANRHGEALAEQACEFLIGACSHFLNRSIEIVGAIPDDPCMQAAVGAGMSVRDAIEGSPAADAVRGVLSRLLPSPRSAARPATFSLSSSSLPIPSRRWS